MDVIELTKQLGLELQKSEAFKVLDNARKLNDADQELQQQIADFNLARMDLNNEIAKGDDKNTDRVNDINEKIHALYMEIMNNESMVAYNQAKNQMDTLMQYITDILTAAVNGEDPTAVQQSSVGCSGSCGSCGGCH